MIFIGLTERQKQMEIIRYARENSIKKVIVFSPENFFMGLPDLPDIRQIGYKETIMYRTFYPLLAEIDETYLLVMNEMMRDRNRSCLTYNCVAKYTNQTPHLMVFECVPCVDEAKDIMILLDFGNSQRYKGRGISDIDLKTESIVCVRHDYALTVEYVDLPEPARAQYEAEKNKLFDGIGNKDPDTIPRQLELFVGRWKAVGALPGRLYAARNSRFHRQDVVPFPDVETGNRYVWIDFQHSHKDTNDYFRRTGDERPTFISTGLPVDNYYMNEHERWRVEVEKIYAETGVYTEDR